MQHTSPLSAPGRTKTMPIISTADRFLGSLVGAYMGHSYANRPDTRNSLLYQSWLDDIQQNRIPGPTLSDFSPAVSLPWLLYHHDDSRTRHDWLAHSLEPIQSTAPDHVTTTMGVLYILGDSLEWLMQCLPTVQHPLPLLCKHLRHQLSTYPPGVSAQVTPLIEWLSSESLRPSPVRQDILVAAMALALQQCLKYRENLAFALNNDSMSQPAPAMIGCLLGAWGGTAIIPTPWMMSLAPDSRQDLSHIAQHIYRNWAGISCIEGTFETLPLDL